MRRALVALVALALAVAPFALPGAKPLGVTEKICVMAALAASYDVLIGYVGIVSFAHAMFFGLGAYGLGLTAYAYGPAYGALGLLAGMVLAGLTALGVGLFALRVQAIFFAMTTLAIAYCFNIAASQWPTLTGGEDGRSFRALIPSAHYFGVTGRTLSYYLVFLGAALVFGLLLRVVNSPFGRVLQAIRENPLRAEAMGYRIVVHRTLAGVVAAIAAAFVGGLDAQWQRYVGPDTASSFSLQLDMLVIVVIGGRGTILGSLIGAAVFVIAETYLRAALTALSGPALLNPDRWLLWLGLGFILAVRFAPKGILGGKPL